MNKILLVLILGTLLIGTAFGQVILTSRAVLPEDKSDILIEKGLTSVDVSELNCREDFCSFWIIKEGYIQTERRIERTHQVCSDNQEDVEVCDEPICRMESQEICEPPVCSIGKDGKLGECLPPVCSGEFQDVEVCDEPICHIETTNNQVCSIEQRTDEELLSERDKIVNSALSELAESVSYNTQLKGDKKIVTLK